MSVDRYHVSNFCRLVLRTETQLDALVIEYTLIRLSYGKHFCRRFTLIEENRTSVHRHTIHEYLQPLVISTLRDEQIIAEVCTLMRVRHVGAVDGKISLAASRNISDGDTLSRRFVTDANHEVRLFHLYRTIAQRCARFIVLCKFLWLIRIVRLSTEYREDFTILLVVTIILIDGNISIAITISEGIFPLCVVLRFRAVSTRVTVSLVRLYFCNDTP